MSISYSSWNISIKFMNLNWTNNTIIWTVFLNSYKLKKWKKETILDLIIKIQNYVFLFQESWWNWNWKTNNKSIQKYNKCRLRNMNWIQNMTKTKNINQILLIIVNIKIRNLILFISKKMIKEEFLRLDM